MLILVDGVPFYEASTVQRTFNLNSLDVKSIRRIEIIKGAQTVLYGGQALSGVIKIETLPQDISQRTTFQGQIGTQNARDLTVTHVEPLFDNQGALFRGHGSWKDAESPVLDSSKVYPRNNWNGEGAYIWRGPVEGNLKASYIQELNNSASSNPMNFKIIDADDFEIFNRQLALSSSVKLNDFYWRPHLSLGAQNSLRQFNQPVNSTNPSLTDQDYGSNLKTVRLDLTPYKGDQVTILAGLSYVYEDFAYRDKGAELSNSFAEQRGVFAKVDYTPHKDISLSVGGRLENWADKDAVGTYQAGLTLFLKKPNWKFPQVIKFLRCFSFILLTEIPT